jgi:transcriptional regulator with XRE-family HTH domain
LSGFGEALTQLLAERGLSQNALGQRIGVSGTAVSYWITGKTTPSYENVVHLEDEFAIEPRGSLLRLAGYSADDTSDQPTAESLIRADPGLHPEDKRVLLRIIALARQRFEPE